MELKEKLFIEEVLDYEKPVLLSKTDRTGIVFGAGESTETDIRNQTETEGGDGEGGAYQGDD